MIQSTQGSALVGIDAGTTSVKSVLFTLDGSVLATATREAQPLQPDLGASEMDMELVWQLTLETLHEVLAEREERQIIAIGVTGQGDGAWLLNEHGEAVAPATLWNDGRSAALIAQWHTGREAVQQATGSPLFSGALPAIWERAKQHYLDANATTHLNCKDWLRFRLTGNIATDPTEASRTYLDVSTGSYSTQLADAVGHYDVFRMLAPVLPSTEVAGTLLPDIQRELGLPQAVPVAIGAVDTATTGVGLGALNDGDSFVIFGTTAVVCMNQNDADHRKHPDSILLRTGRDNQVLESLAQMSGMPNLQWARNTLGFAEQSWDEIEAAATVAAPHTATGLVYLPYTAPSGERAPFVDPHAVGAWVGARVSTTRADMMRAVYCGLVHSVYESLLALGVNDAPDSAEIAVSGGGAQSTLLCQLLADLTGKTVVRQRESEVGARGAAAFALAAVNPTRTLHEAVASMQAQRDRVLPRAEHHAQAQQLFSTFVRMRDAIRSEWSALALNAAPADSESTGRQQ